MPTTSVTIANSLSGPEGTISIKEGQTVGPAGRTLVLEATPATGYIFDKWEIQNSPIQLQEFARVGLRYKSTEEVCSDESINLTTILYTDGSRLFTDIEGKYEARFGFYQAGRNVYYNYLGSGIPTLQECIQNTTPILQQQTSGGGGGGIRNIDTRFVENGTFSTSGEFDQTVGFDFGPNVQ